MTVNGRMRRRAKKRKTWLLVLVLAVVLLAGYVYYAGSVDVAAEPEEPAMQTTTVRKGDIVITAVGSGNLMPSAEVSLGFRSGGTLVEIPVNVGDVVAAGDVLARLDDTAAHLQLSQAALNMEQAQARLVTAQATSGQALDIAEANLAAVQADYDALVLDEAHTGDRLTPARVNLEQAREALEDAQVAYNVAWDPGRDWELTVQRYATALENERVAATRALERAQDALEVARANYNLVQLSAGDDSATQAAWVKVLDARRDVEDARAGSSIQEAGWAVEQTGLALASAQLALDNTQLLAPFTGTVASIDARSGEAVGTAPIVTLIDVSAVQVRFYLEESDLARVVPGHKVNVVFDALPDQTFAGQVTRVDPALVSVDGTLAVQAWAALDLDTKQLSLPTGLTAEVEVIAGEAYKVLVVPVQALRELAPGQFAVFVVEADGALKLRPVEIGLRDFANAQVLSGLEMGEIISTGTVETE